MLLSPLGPIGTFFSFDCLKSPERAIFLIFWHEQPGSASVYRVDISPSALRAGCSWFDTTPAPFYNGGQNQD
jgi:hypothetical protein